MNKINGLENTNFKSKTAVCLGNFDGLHLGHRHIIATLKREAEKAGGIETVIFTLNPHPVKFFGKTLTLLSTSRVRDMLFAETGADYLVTADFNHDLSGLPPEDFFRKIIVEKLNAAVVVVGDDYRFGTKKSGDTELMKKLGADYGVECVFVEKIKDEDGTIISSSHIRSLLQDGRVVEAQKFLARPYSLEGIVIHGDGRGKLFGFPTINLKVDNELIPALGVYATKTLIQNRTYNSMTYIGKRPTINDYTEIRVETNLFGFDEDVYDEFAQIFFYGFIRGEAKFANVEELKKQMATDMSDVKNALKNI